MKTKPFLLFIFFLLSNCSFIKSELKLGPKHPYSIVQGLTTETKTQLNILGPHKNLQIEIRDQDGQLLLGHHLKRIDHQLPHTKMILTSLEVSGLSPQKNYLLLISQNDKVLDRRNFSTLSLSKQLKFALLSCIHEDYHQHGGEELWDQLLNEKLDMIFLIGDNVYHDSFQGSKLIDGATPQSMEEVYVRYRKKLKLFHHSQLRPLLATWDDHDYGKNNADRRYQYKNQARDLFHQFWAQSSPNTSYYHKGPGVSFAFQTAKARFLFLDNRSFRSPNHEKSGTHYGPEQERWLWGRLADSNRPTWLINGDQFFGGYHPYESFEGKHPHAFRRFLTRLKKFPMPLIFASGDRHMAEVMKVSPRLAGQQTYELTSSGFHAKTYPGSLKAQSNPRRIDGVDGQFNYMLINPLSSSDKHLEFEVISKGPGNKVHFKHQLKTQL